MKRILAIAALIGLGLGFVGCGGQPAASGPTTGAEKAAEMAAADNSTGDKGETTTAPSFSTATPVELDISPDATPDEVVTAFLEARRSGDPMTTAGLLTSTARAATAKHKIDVNGEALPDLQFQVAKPKFLKNNPKGAHVSSLWTELLPDGTKASYEVVWVLRKEAVGWRVAGFAAELTPGAEPQFLNFEDPDDMMKKQQEAVAAAEQVPLAEPEPIASKPQPTNRDTRKGGPSKKR